MTLPQTYKRAVFTSAGSPLTIEEVSLQLPGKNEVLVKVEACGVCYSDTFGQHNSFGAAFPIVPGHEVIGRVAAVGEGVEAWKVDDKIGAGWHGGHDGTCGTCRRGIYHMCDNQAITGATRPGGYAEYVLVRSEAGVPVPDGIDAAHYAPFLCAGVTMFNSLRRQNISPGETVAVEGLGGLGHLGIQYANKFGYRVVAISRGADKEPFARELGAHEYIDSSKGDPGEALKALGGAALVMSTNPGGQQLPKLLKGLAPLGKLLILSLPGDVPVDTGLMIKYGLSVTAWPTGHSLDMEETLKFSKLHEVNCLVEKFPLERANEAFEAMLSGRVRFRAVLTMD